MDWATVMVVGSLVFGGLMEFIARKSRRQIKDAEVVIDYCKVQQDCNVGDLKVVADCIDEAVDDYDRKYRPQSEDD